MIDNNEQKGNYYIIADHLRTTIFALADGATFEPKGRGYILKKLVKKSTLLAYLLGLNSEQLQKEIDKSMEFISKSTQKLNRYYTPAITTEDIFFWYDTKGIPEELIRFYL